MAKIRVQTTVNGEPAEFLCEPAETLLDALRDRLGLTGTKEGCATGDCGACSVIMNGRLVPSCLVLARRSRRSDDHDGRRASRRAMRCIPLQQQFLEHAALQCGICTPGFIVAAKALLDRQPDPTEKEVRYWLAGNLCRCTGYDKIVRAVLGAAGDMRKAARMSERTFTYVGTRPIRHDGLDKVTGRANYGADFSLPGMLQGVVLRSPHAHARIVSIDTSAAAAMPGVKAIVTGSDIPKTTASSCSAKAGSISPTWATTCSRTTRCSITATPSPRSPRPRSRSRAKRPTLIDVVYEVLQPVLTLDQALAPDAPILHDDLVTKGQPAAGRDGADQHRRCAWSCAAATSTRASPRPTSSSSASSRRRWCTRATSSRTPASRATARTARC